MTRQPSLRQCPITAEVARRMRARRKAIQMTLVDQAAAMTEAGYPMSHTGICDIEKGYRRDLPIRLIVAAAVALHTRVADLLPDPGSCPTCEGSPPLGFSCNACGSGGSR
ncbi:hypothetical protein [Embleya sp. NPDC059237]|uniref:hypothetical protein n=1 Tax=Embleya sp. NPDC059237 TaxID=3346784 RepID=UPI00368A83AF